MPYAVEQDIVDLHSAPFLVMIADRDGNGAADPAAVSAAISAAESEINSRLSVRYVTPLADPAPEMVKIATVEIASYRLANNGGVLTEDIRKRYDDMISWLKDVAAGKANIGVPEIDDGAEDGDLDWKLPTVFVGKAVKGS